MAYDEHLAERISKVLNEKKVRFEAKRMMGGLCYMIKDKMTVGIIHHSLMVRIDPLVYESALKKNGCRPMNFTGKTLKGFVLIDPVGIDMDHDLDSWIQLSLDFNPKAKSSKKKSAKKPKKTAVKSRK
jgi:TfoX/Sxy family transcriptional regulator of competence genes